jgi:hypothetical protein
MSGTLCFGSPAFLCRFKIPFFGKILEGDIMRHICMKLVTFAVIGIMAIATSSCREEEQGRLLSYEKGTYLGQADTALSAEQLNELANRSRLQSGY